MHLLRFLSFALTVVPVLALMFWLWPVFHTRWQRTGPLPRMGILALWLLGTTFLLALPHDDMFTGLDNMAYRNMTHAFLAGRGFHDPDTVLAHVPKNLRRNFLYSPGPLGRPTRDRCFRLSNWTSVETQPFFLPLLPLAAGGAPGVCRAEQFVPLMGSLWLALVLVAGFCSGGGWGVFAVAALLLGTAWPAWFLRGFYTEAVGGMLASSVLLVAFMRPPVKGILALAGFMLGLSIAYHPTLVVLAAPVALALALDDGRLRSTVFLAGGFALGLAPFLAIYVFVCQPYGIILQGAQIRQLLAVSPEHRALAWVLGIIVLATLVLISGGLSPRVRLRVQSIPKIWQRATWLFLCVLPIVLIVVPHVLPNVLRHEIRIGALAAWSGVRCCYALLCLAGAMLILFGNRPMRDRFMLMVLCWGLLFFLFLKGHETPVGVWSQRRLLPSVLMGIACLAFPLSAALERYARLRYLRIPIVILVLMAGLANLVRWPVAYTLENETGAGAWTQSVADYIGTNRWVIFDYYPHSVPYAAGLRHKVLGLGERSIDHWPETSSWIASLAQSQEVCVVTSWLPCTLEENYSLEPVVAVTGRFPIAKCKNYFPMVKGERQVINHFLSVVPLDQKPTLAQDKYMDHSPIGLRGPWGLPKDSGRGRMARWSRQGSGIIGPLPHSGHRVRFRMDCAFDEVAPEWTSQTVRIVPPYGLDVREAIVTNGWQTVELEFTVDPSHDHGPLTGVYLISVEKPYDPAAYGLRGYPTDLGIQVRRIEIWAEPVVSLERVTTEAGVGG